VCGVLPEDGYMIMLLVLLESSHVLVPTPVPAVASPGLRLGSCFVGRSVVVLSGSVRGLLRDWHGLPAGSRDSSSGSKEPVTVDTYVPIVQVDK